VSFHRSDEKFSALFVYAFIKSVGFDFTMDQGIESGVDWWESQFYQPIPKDLKVGRTKKRGKREKEHT